MAKSKDPEKAVVNLKIEDPEDRIKFKAWIDQGILASENAIASLRVQYKEAKLEGTAANIKHMQARISGFKWLISRMNPGR